MTSAGATASRASRPASHGPPPAEPSRRTVRSESAMAGEDEVKGQVLPIGGLREKALAAQRAGVTRVIAPRLNQADLDDFPQHLIDEMDFIFVAAIDQVLAEALEEE